MLPAQVLNGKDEQKLAVKLNFKIVAFFAILFDLIAKYDLPQRPPLYRAWGVPALYALEGINIGFQLGGQATDFVLLVMNPKGAESLLTSKVKLGADASAAVGVREDERLRRHRRSNEC